MKRYSSLLALLLVMAGCSNPSTELENKTLASLTSDVSANPVAYIPPQCYTNPIDENTVSNPCYVCHTESKRPNFLNDSDVQLSFSFPEPGAKNHWTNFFKDWTKAISRISDEEIISYVREDNYLNSDSEIIISKALRNIPKEWDRNKNGQWDGYTPDAYFNFDALGFDKAPDQSYTGWRVFAYYPFPGTFMPTNGSTDDVLIRLPKVFQENEDGKFNIEVYQLNLAILESIMKEKDVPIQDTDESKFNVDLDKDGVISFAKQITYQWAPLKDKHMSYVGNAGVLQAKGNVKLAARLFPVGTEFLHSVRYIDAINGQTKMAKRMKELRYAKKNNWRNYHQLETIVNNEIKERHDFPERTKQVMGNMETGLSVAHGWTYQGFIEDSAGALRPQTYEETYFCTGCHGGSGAANDTIISFNRKFDQGTFKDGWYHWFEKGLTGIKEPRREDGKGEFAFYLEHNPTGNEYRANPEVYNKFFSVDGKKKEAAFEKLSQDISHLLMPSEERAALLNKAYLAIVKEQSFSKGRDPIIAPITTVHKTVDIDADTGIKNQLSYY